MKVRKPSIKDSYIVRFFAFITHFIYTTLSAGFLGRVFTSYTATDQAFRSSHVGRLARTTEQGGGKFHRALRRNIAFAMNESRIVGGVSAFLRLLCRCSVRTVGLFFLTSGAYSAIMYWLFSVIWKNGTVNVFNLFGGIASLVLGILLLFSDVSLGYALSKGVFFDKILVSVFGVSDDTFKDVEREGKQGYVVAVPLGMVLGAVSALTSPLYLLAVAVAFLLLVLILSVPEAGVMLLILFLPFAGFLPKSEFWILLFVAVPLVAYFGKLLRGNRAFHMEIQDMPVLLMLILFLLSGFSVAGVTAWKGALLSAAFVGIYFLVVNVIATPRWMNRCRVALIVSATAASLLGIFQFVFAAVTLDGASMSAIGGHVCAGFADHTTFAYFLVLVFPFTLAAFISAKKRYRLPTGFAMVAVTAAAVLTWVQSAMIAILVMLIVFLLVYDRRTFPFVLMGTALTPLVLWFLPDGVRNRFLSVLRTDSDAALARSSGAGSLAVEIFFEKGSGVFGRSAGFARLMFGLGNGGIEQFCTLYTSVPSDLVAKSLNFWLYRLLEGGVLGVILPAAFFFFLYQNCFSVMRSTSSRGHCFSAITGVAMITGVLILSIFRYSWYDPGALVAFFLAAALIIADLRYVRSRSLPTANEGITDGSVAELEYYGGVR